MPGGVAGARLTAAPYADQVNQFSVGTFAPDHHTYRAHHDGEVGPDVPVVDVLTVQLDPFVVVHVIAAADLPQARQASGDTEVVLARGGVIAVQFLPNHRTGTDDAHVTAQHIPQLRQFVEAGLADEATDTGDARIVLQLEVAVPFGTRIGIRVEQMLQHFVRVRHHRTKLVALEFLAIAAHAGVAVDDLLARGQPHGQCHAQHDRPEQGQDDHDADQVEGALGSMFDPAQTDLSNLPGRLGLLQGQARSIHARSGALRADQRLLRRYAGHHGHGRVVSMEHAFLPGLHFELLGSCTLHNHFANSGATVGLLARRHAKISWSFTIHGISEFDYPAGVNLAAKVEAASFVACVSYFGRAQAARMVDPSYWPRLRIVRCGLELDRLPLPVSEDGHQIRLIFVGRLSAEKGVSGLIEAMSLMKSGTPSKLVIVGDGPLRASLERQRDALGLAERIEFLGRLSERETMMQIARSDVLVLPSFMEGLPVVLMEALGLGIPVVASRVAGIPELVEHGCTGLLFSASNWPELADSLDRLLDDNELRQLLGRNGPPRIAREFDVLTSASRLHGLFQEVAQSEPTPAARLA